MRVGFSEEEYLRVRGWLVSAIEVNPDKITESQLLDKLRSGDWHLITIENAACVLQCCICEGEKIANILLVGGEKNQSLRSIMKAHSVLCDHLRKMDFAKLVGQPRKEFHAYLKRNGFAEAQNQDFEKELF
ncbi:hypothetical protein ASD31_09180 [Rhizobium sp. Root482]|nr:hypothetical protein ASD31_09180 [Rhizobium sp. Root482]